MTVDRLTRVNELLKREIGEILFRIIQEDDFDLSAITVTDVSISRNLRNARVMVSIRDHQDQRQRMLAILRNYRGEIQKHISNDVILKYTPRLSFELDTSIEKGDAILGLIHKMELEGQLGTPEPETQEAPPDNNSKDQ
jgi:ribosome-binding factor A